MCEWGNTTQLVVDHPGKVIDVDFCIASLVLALNANGFATVASCCGHGKRPGNIALRDGRELIIAKDFDEGRQIDSMFPNSITEETESICEQCLGSGVETIEGFDYQGGYEFFRECKCQ